MCEKHRGIYRFVEIKDRDIIFSFLSPIFRALQPFQILLITKECLLLCQLYKFAVTLCEQSIRDCETVLFLNLHYITHVKDRRMTYLTLSLVFALSWETFLSSYSVCFSIDI